MCSYDFPEKTDHSLLTSISLIRALIVGAITGGLEWLAPFRTMTSYTKFRSALAPPETDWPIGKWEMFPVNR